MVNYTLWYTKLAIDLVNWWQCFKAQRASLPMNIDPDKPDDVVDCYPQSRQRRWDSATSTIVSFPSIATELDDQCIAPFRQPCTFFATIYNDVRLDSVDASGSIESRAFYASTIAVRW